MLTAYTDYKAKLERAAEPRQKRTPNDPAVALEWIEKTTAKLAALITPPGQTTKRKPSEPPSSACKMLSRPISTRPQACVKAPLSG